MHNSFKFGSSNECTRFTNKQLLSTFDFKLMDYDSHIRRKRAKITHAMNVNFFWKQKLFFTLSGKTRVYSLASTHA